MKQRILAITLALSLCAAPLHATISGSSNGGAPGGSNGNIQYNNNGALGGIGATSQLTTLDNNTMQLLPHWRAALARVASGSGNATVFVAGDSTMIGYNNGAGNNLLTSPPAQIAAMLNKQGVNASFNSHIGYTAASDGRFSQGSWTNTTGTSVESIGSNGTYYATGTTATPMSFTPTYNVNTFKIYWYSTGSSATFSYNIDGGAASNVVTGTTAGIFTTTVTTTLGPHTINLNWVAAAPGIIGFDSYDSTKSRVDIIDGGAGSTTSATWANAGNGISSGLNTETYLAQDLTLIDIGINDWNFAVSVATYTANMQALITKMLSVGDVLLVTPVPSNPGSNGAPSLAVQQTYVNAMYALAAANNIPIVDTFGRWVSYAVSNALGYYNADGTHPLALGIEDQALQIAGALMGYGQGNNGTPLFAGAYVTGTMGIGTTQPLYPLDIRGAATINGLISNGTKFTTSGCSVSASTGGATSGTYTSGTAGTCSVTITMNGATGLAAPNGWDCQADDRTTPADLITETASTTTTATLSGTTASGDVIGFHCVGY